MKSIYVVGKGSYMQIHTGIIIKSALVFLFIGVLFNTVASAEITGDLTVEIGPPEVIADARWKLSNGDDLDWHASGEYVYDIPIGKNQLQFYEVQGWCKPSIQTVEIKKGKNIAYMNYLQDSCEMTEDITNIRCDEFVKKDVYKDKEVVFNFLSDCKLIKNIKFTGLRNYQMITSKIEVLRTTSTRVDHTPPPVVYQNFNVIIGSESYLSENNTENLSITFSVEKSWIEKNDILIDSIKLYSYDEGTWNSCTTEKIDEDSTHMFFISYPNIEKWGSMAVCGQNSLNPVSTLALPGPGTIVSTEPPTESPTGPPPETVEKNKDDGNFTALSFLFGMTIISYFILRSTSSK